MADYIDRQAALDALDKLSLGETDAIKLFFRMNDYLKRMPSADVQPVRHGNWEERKVSDKNCIDEWQTACCSVCHKYHTTPYMYYFDNYNYCPNCGARMDGERDG